MPTPEGSRCRGQWSADGASKPGPLARVKRGLGCRRPETGST